MTLFLNFAELAAKFPQRHREKSVIAVKPPCLPPTSCDFHDLAATTICQVSLPKCDGHTVDHYRSTYAYVHPCGPCGTSSKYTPPNKEYQDLAYSYIGGYIYAGTMARPLPKARNKAIAGRQGTGIAGRPARGLGLGNQVPWR